jgi:hypothetical protein
MRQITLIPPKLKKYDEFLGSEGCDYVGIACVPLVAPVKSIGYGADAKHSRGSHGDHIQKLVVNLSPQVNKNITPHEYFDIRIINYSPMHQRVLGRTSSLFL